MQMFGKFLITSILLSIAITSSAFTQEINSLIRYKEYTPEFSSSGQLNHLDLARIEGTGFERVIYVGYEGFNENLEDVDRKVIERGIQYLHIPIDWLNPKVEDFETVRLLYDSAKDKKTLMHCHTNYMAGSMSFLVRVINDKIPLQQAKKDLLEIWEPNDVWSNYINSVLKDNGYPKVFN